MTNIPMITKENATFGEWCAELDRVNTEKRLAEFVYGIGSVTDKTGADDWRGYYDDGYDPEDALREDLSCAD